MNFRSKLGLDNSLLLQYSLLTMKVKNAAGLYLLPVSQKGQITIPVEVRKLFDLEEKKKVLLEILDENRVAFKAPKMSLKQVFGSVKPIRKSFGDIRKIAKEERVELSL